MEMLMINGKKTGFVHRWIGDKYYIRPLSSPVLVCVGKLAHSIGPWGESQGIFRYCESTVPENVWTESGLEPGSVYRHYKNFYW